MTKRFDFIRKGLLSLIGLAGIWASGHSQIIMGNGFTTACSGNFYDSGGSGSNYGNSQDFTYTIYPNAGNNLQVVFSSFSVETCCDWLRIHNGNSTAAPQIGQYTSNPGTITSTAPDGSLTFVFHSDGSVTSSGWAATISCIPLPPCAGAPNPGTATASAPVVCPGINFNINVQNVVNASGMQYQWQSSPNGITWSDIPGQINAGFNGTQTAALNYRLRAICTTGPDTAYSTTVFVDLGQCINMTNATVTTCGANFFDSGGQAGNYQPSEDYTLTIYPNAGNYAQVAFTAFQLETCCDWLRIYDGNSTSAPLIGQFTSNPGTILATSFDGSLTFEFHSDGSVQYLGWQATLSCVPKPPNEVELLSIDNPGLGACSFNNNLLVTIRNNGTNVLTSASFDVNIGGLVTPGNVWNGSLNPGDAQQIQVPGSFFYNDGDTLGVKVSLPNGQADADSTDNYKGMRTYLALQGIYKVGYGINNADTIADIPTAIGRLHLRGICDTVYFDLKDGVYNGRYTINQYPGWNAGEMVIFRSESQNAMNVTLTDSAGTAANNFVFRLNGADGIGFQHVTLNPRSAAYRTAIDLLNGAHYLYVDNSRLLADTSLAGTGSGNFDQILIRSANATTDNHSVITNNILRGGSRAINLGAAANEYESGHVIRNNTISNIAFLSVIINGQNGFVFEGNTINIPSYTNIANPLGIQYSGSIGSGSITGNRISSSKEGSLILLSNVKGIANNADPVKVTNNFLYSSDSVHVTGNAAISVFDVNSAGISIANNSISYFGNNTASGAIYVADGSDVSVYNNNIGVWNNAYAIKIDKPYSLVNSDHNNFYSEGTYLGFYNGAAQNTLTAWQSATGKDGASMSVTPGFNGSDLHTCTPQLNGAAMPLNYIAIDFDGDGRMSTPDIGADEFFGGPEGLITTEDNFLKCPSESVTFGGTAVTGVTYSWNPGGATTPSLTTTNAGTYIITGTSACGSFSDTVVVSNQALPVAAFNIGNSVGLSAAFNNTSTNANSYMWNFGDGTTSTEVSPTHIYTSGGSYVITLTAYGDCDTVTTTQTYIAVALGNEEFSKGSITLYPNPAVENVNISFAGVTGGETEILVLDMSGKALRTANTNVNSGSVYTLDVNGLVPGVYMVRITMGDAVSVHRIVKK